MEIVFGAEGWRGVTADAVTIPNVRVVSQALADDLLERQAEEQGVVIGYDTRFLSEAFARECAQVLAGNGVSVYLLDTVVPTPLLSFAVRYHGAAVGVMVSGGTRPPEWNGLAWKGPHAGPIMISELKYLAAKVGRSSPRSRSLESAMQQELLRYANCDEPYVHHLLRLTSVSARKKRRLRLVVDAMHGSGGHLLTQALEEFGSEVIPMRMRHDPLFGGCVPDPAIAEQLMPLQEKVKDSGADLGLALSGDGARLAAVDETGRVLTGQELFGLTALHLMRERGWRGSLVKTSDVGKRIVDALGKRFDQRVREVGKGFKNVQDRVQREDVLLAGDGDGNLLIPRHMPERDGLFVGLLLLEHLLWTEQSLAEAVDEMNGIVEK
ncbi:phosphoglucomutase [Tumebacillus permanentifrigoris]|uniref:Phosphoglucomutase n=1 Tax=Tumebacillus permanentifrigoris TaxID=378543 RepID=A0A316DDS2_9BACL|nr:phosphoglucomutase [Tumebacillus permanentifrigoris]PWK15778.1 phosphomannomutase [Tumebacillus permanentifrigoris]